MVEITNRGITGDVRYTDANYEMTGDFRQNPESKEIVALNLSATKKNGGEMGSVNAYMESGELKLNMNNIPFTEMAGIATAVTNCINEIKNDNQEL